MGGVAKINVLEKQVAELIAAGEVVERPASIVKELLENAVDAGASSVTVEIRRGGISYIRVTDNGSGIEREDVAKAFLRHATSKVRERDDLGQITTMGFRGEALASIAAMCRVELLTRAAEEEVGTLYTISGGEEESLEDAGCPVGTTITIRDVFFNTPARMKFLKKDVSEGNSVAAAVEKAALGYPGVGFKLIRDGQVRFQTPGDGHLLSAVRCVFGKEFSENLLPVHYESKGCMVDGVICKPTSARNSRSMQNFFINTRFVRSKTCMAALEESYRNALMTGKYPSCVLNLTIPPQTVDVNVHPAKIEVRFADEKSIFQLVYYGCKTALGIANLAPELKAEDLQQNPSKREVAKPAAPVQQRMSADAYRMTLAQKVEHLKSAREPVYDQTEKMDSVKPSAPVRFPGIRVSPEAVLAVESPVPVLQKVAQTSSWPAPVISEIHLEPPEASAPGETSAETLYDGARLIGELFDTYLLLQNGDELILVDKHAAHERLLFNRLASGGLAEERQLLLTPVSVQLSPEEHALVTEHLTLLSQVGVTAEDFGDHFVLVREVAPILADADLPGLVTEFAERLSCANGNLLPGQLEELYHRIACRAAIKAHDRTPAPTLEQLIRLLQQDGNVGHCPHGRPVAIRMARREIEKKFGRLG